jgi:hypothetical protein
MKILTLVRTIAMLPALGIVSIGADAVMQSTQTIASAEAATAAGAKTRIKDLETSWDVNSHRNATPFSRPIAALTHF